MKTKIDSEAFLDAKIQQQKTLRKRAKTNK